MTDKQTYVLYHKDCADGTASALAAYKYFGEEATYIACQYQEDPPELSEGSQVYLVDFSFPRPVLEELTKKHEVVVLDHHKTAQEALLGLGSLKDQVFDMNRSAAVITWQYFFPNEIIPELFYYVQDRDLWQWTYEETKSVSAYLTTLGFNDFKKWLPLLKRREVSRVREKGEAICEYQNKCVENNIKKFYWGELPDGTGIWMTNNSHLISETCNTFLKENPEISVCCCWFNVDGSKVVYSLRGDGKFDCSELAKRFNGGGHQNAAGFSIDL